MAGHPSQARGLSLGECLISLVIIGLLATQVAPNFSAYIEQKESQAAVHRLTAALHLTRNVAIAHQKKATLCPWDIAHQHCGGQWQNETMIFLDANNNRRLDPGDLIIRQLPALAKNSLVRFRSFGNRQYLRMTAAGMTDHQNGNLLYCPPSRNAKQAAQIIIHASGRARLARDSDGDGIAEDSRGRALRC